MSITQKASIPITSIPISTNGRSHRTQKSIHGIKAINRTQAFIPPFEHTLELSFAMYTEILPHETRAYEKGSIRKRASIPNSQVSKCKLQVAKCQLRIDNGYVHPPVASVSLLHPSPLSLHPKGRSHTLFSDGGGRPRL